MKFTKSLIQLYITTSFTQPTIYYSLSCHQHHAIHYSLSNKNCCNVNYAIHYSLTMAPSTASATMMPTMTDCNGSGWRRIAFINMTDISYNTYCPTGLNLTSYSKRTCGRLYKTWGGCFSTTLIQCWRFTIQPYMWEDKGIPVGGGGD